MSDMNFSEALAACKAGSRICRSGWNGKNMWVAFSPGFELPPEQIFSPPIREHVGNGTGTFLPYLMMLTAQGDFVPWLVSQTDLLAEDWQVVTI